MWGLRGSKLYRHAFVMKQEMNPQNNQIQPELPENCAFLFKVFLSVSCGHVIKEDPKIWRLASLAITCESRSKIAQKRRKLQLLR